MLEKKKEYIHHMYIFFSDKKDSNVIFWHDLNFKPKAFKKTLEIKYYNHGEDKLIRGKVGVLGKNIHVCTGN